MVIEDVMYRVEYGYEGVVICITTATYCTIQYIQE